MPELTPFHLAIPVRDLAAARAFYGELLGCAEGRSAADWVDFDFFGHQLVCHAGRRSRSRTPGAQSGGRPRRARAAFRHGARDAGLGGARRAAEGRRRRVRDRAARALQGPVRASRRRCSCPTQRQRARVQVVPRHRGTVVREDEDRQELDDPRSSNASRTFRRGVTASVIDAIARAISGSQRRAAARRGPGRRHEPHGLHLRRRARGGRRSGVPRRGRSERADRHVEAPGRASAHGRARRLSDRAGVRRDDGPVRRDRRGRSAVAWPRRSRCRCISTSTRRHGPSGAISPTSAAASTKACAKKLADPGLGAGRGPGDLQRAARRDGRRRARVPDRLQRQPQHARAETGERGGAQHPRGGAAEARRAGRGRQGRRGPGIARCRDVSRR